MLIPPLMPAAVGSYISAQRDQELNIPSRGDDSGKECRYRAKECLLPVTPTG